MLAYAAGALLLVVVGTIAGASLASALPVLFVLLVATSLLRVYGDWGATVGVLLAITLCMSIDVPGHTIAHAASRALLLGAGIAGAIVLALLLWPVRPWGPARHAAAATLEGLSALAREIGVTYEATPAAGGDDAWARLATRMHPPVRHALEESRDAIAETRLLRAASSPRGDDLLAVQASASRLFALLVALEEELAASRGTSRAAVAAAVQQVAALLGVAALRVTSDRRRSAPAELAAVDHAILALWDEVESERPDGVAPATHAHLAHLAHAAALLETAATESQDALAASDRVRDGFALVARGGPSASDAPRQDDREPWWAPLRATLSPDSLMLRHAVRLAVAATLTYAMARQIGYGHGLWATTTVVVVLQPWAGTTFRRGLERVAGTVGGGVLAALLSLAVPGPVVVAMLMFPLAVAAVAVRRVHYGAFTFFLTPVFILMTEQATGDWQLAGARIGATLAGGALALVASRLLWPSWEHQRLPGQLATALESSRSLLRLVRDPGGHSAAALEAARRAAGLAVLNVEAALQRFLAEPRRGFRDVAALLELVAHQRRLHGALTALAHRPGTPARDAASAELLDAADSALGDVAMAIRQGRRPPPPPAALEPHARTGEFRLDAAGSDHAPLAAARVARHVSRLADAAARAI